MVSGRHLDDLTVRQVDPEAQRGIRFAAVHAERDITHHAKEGIVARSR